VDAIPSGWPVGFRAHAERGSTEGRSIVPDTPPPPTPSGPDDAGGPLWAASSLPVGAAVQPDLLERDPAYRDTLAREFNAVTPEDAMKWEPIHPSRDGWNFDPADQLVSFAEARGMRVHGHTLVWHDQLPTSYLTPSVSQAEAARLLASHIETLVGRYAGRIAAWDVVNEAIAEDGRGLRDDAYFLLTFGPGYIEEAFRRAHTADRGARLYYNDFDADADGLKSDAVYELVRDLREAGAPIHGVGLQMHLEGTAPPAPDAIAANVARLQALGLEVRISEMDVRIRKVGRRDPRVDPLAVQRAIYHDTIAACAAMPGFAGVTFWGVSDQHSWFNRRDEEEPPAPERPLLLDRDYAPKPAYFGVRAALAASRRTHAAQGHRA
jgi:endo-1,4-beta-xylanase